MEKKTDQKAVRRMHIRLTEDQHRGLQRIAVDEGSTKSAILRRAVIREIRRAESTGDV